MSYYIANSYYNTLLNIQNNAGTQLTQLPVYETTEDIIEPLIKLDLNTRQIILPPEYDPESIQKGFLGLENDHLADYIYFIVDRYYEDVDLFKTAVVVEYINAKKQPRLFPVVLKDIVSMPGKMIFAWHIGNEATKMAGIIQFSVRFFLVHPTENKFEYNLGFEPVSSKILEGLGEIDWDDAYIDFFNKSTYHEIISAIEAARHIYWVDV